MSEMEDFIHGLPKCELHVHVEGTLEPEMKFMLAKRNAIALPYADVAEMRAAYTFNDLPSFLKIYYEGMNVLVTEQDFYDLAYAYYTRAASENVLYTEMFFDPQPHTGRGVAFNTVIQGLRRAQMDAEANLGIKSQLILCFLRDWSAEFAMTTLIQSLPYKDWIVGVGLDSDEKGHPPVKFKNVFARARAEGYKLTMHCDVNQENTLGHIRQVLNEIGVDRIDHGVNAIEDAALCAEIKARELALTICPVSNGFCTDGSQADVIKQMLNLGMKPTVNSDDPAYFGGYMDANFIRTQHDANLTKAELAQLSRNAFESTWLPQAAKAEYLAKLDAYCAQ
jgi:adenosine deaminase